MKQSKSGATTHLSRHLESAKHKEAMEKKDGPSVPKKAKVESIATIFSPGYSIQQSQQLTSDVTDFIGIQTYLFLSQNRLFFDV